MSCQDRLDDGDDEFHGMAPGCRLALDSGTSNHRGNANRANANMAIKSCAMRAVANPMRELNRRTPSASVLRR